MCGCVVSRRRGIIGKASRIDSKRSVKFWSAKRLCSSLCMFCCLSYHFAPQKPPAKSLGKVACDMQNKGRAVVPNDFHTTAQPMSQCLPIAELLLILQRCRFSFAHLLAQVIPQRFVSSEAVSTLPSAHGGNICTISH